MANVHVFDSLAGYTGDVDHTAIVVATAYIVIGGVNGYQIVGARMAPSAQVIGAYAYCWGRNPNQLLAVKACPTLEGGVFNDVMFDAPVDVAQFPGGRYYVVGFYLPNGNYLLKGAVFAGVNIPSPSDSNVMAAESGDSASTGGLPGNGVFLAGALATPAAPPAAPAWGAFNSNHYGVDAIIAQPGAPLAPANTVAPAITGTAVTGSALSCSLGTWTGDPVITYFRQWKRAGASISGATGAAYTLQVADEGQAITCTVTATNSVGSTSATSNSVTPTAPTPGAPANTVAPVVTGGTTTGSLLTTTDGTWSNSPTSFARQWQRDGTDISGAIGTTYTLAGVDEGHSIRCRVTATNTTGSASANSNAINATPPPLPPDATSGANTRLWSNEGGAFTLLTFGGKANRPGDFDFDDYADSVDDAAAWRQCVADAVAYGIDNDYFARVLMSPRETVWSSAPIETATSFGQGIIPPIPEIDRKFELVIECPGAAAAGWNHWNQATPRIPGALIRSTMTGIAPRAGYGGPSIVTGPYNNLPANGMPSLYSNMLVVWRGISLMGPHDAGIIGLNLKHVAMAEGQVLVMANATSTFMNGHRCTNDQGIAVMLPQINNNDHVRFDVKVMGWYFGCNLVDHMTTDTAGFIYTRRALYLETGGGIYHGATIDNLSIEVTDTMFFVLNSDTSTRFPLVVAQANIETTPDDGVLVVDPNDALSGIVFATNNTGRGINKEGGRRLQIVDLTRSVAVRNEPGLRPESYAPPSGDMTHPDVCVAALRACLADAVLSSMNNGSFRSEVVLDPDRIYDVGSEALAQGGATSGNSQVPIPIVAPTSRKPVLKIRGIGPVTAMPHWNQISPQRLGGVIKSSLASAYSATHGMPSVLGGPTPEHGYGTSGALFNNLHLVIENVMIVAPTNPAVCGWDFHGMAAVTLYDIAAQADQVPSAAPLLNTFMFGLRMPANGNNLVTEIGSYSCEGFYRGIIAGEHTSAKDLNIALCHTGLGIGGPNGHAMHIAHAKVESCVDVVEYVDLGTVAWGADSATLVIDLLDTEDSTDGDYIASALIRDPGNMLRGKINVNPNGGVANTTKVGGTHLTIFDLHAGANI